MDFGHTLEVCLDIDTEIVNTQSKYLIGFELNLKNLNGECKSVDEKIKIIRNLWVNFFRLIFLRTSGALLSNQTCGLWFLWTTVTHNLWPLLKPGAHNTESSRYLVTDKKTIVNYCQKDNVNYNFFLSDLSFV